MRVFNDRRLHLYKYNHRVCFFGQNRTWGGFGLPFFACPGLCLAVLTLVMKAPSMISKRPLNASLTQDSARPDPALRVLRQFRLVFSAVRRHFQQVEKNAGLGGAPIWAMSLIAQNPGMRVTQLAQAMDIHQSTASNLVRSLTKLGYVHSEKSVTDKRVAELYPLPEGLKLLRKVPGPYNGVLPQALQELDNTTLIELEIHLNLLLQKLQVDERSARTPIAMM